MENYSENNNILIGGVVVSEPEFSHEVFEEKFYSFNIETKRLSDYHDILPVIISERLMDIKSIKKDLLIKIQGQFRSYNKLIDNRSKLVLSIFAKEIEMVEDESIITLNEANFIGYICKHPIYRKTPLGREIADVLVAVNRSYKKSDYIPCILWGRNAKFCETLGIGARVKLTGRIQSRKYEKKLEDGTVISKVAYEVSISKFAIDKEEEKPVENSVIE
ncbi:MAG: single-stranded DNA-binding protein [Clostridia bacterium]|nr:single-stranded DNA-binding protein [Clostridia bacterium]